MERRLATIFAADVVGYSRLLGRHEEGVEHARRSQRLANTAIWANLAELTVLGHLGRSDDARLALERACAVKKDISLAFIDTVLKFKHAEDRDKYIAGLRKAGLSL